MRITPREALQIAIEIEVQGERFYKKYAARTRSRQVRDVFLFLSKQERGHKALYEKMLQAEAMQPTEPFAGDPALFYRVIGRNSVFQDDIGSKVYIKNLRNDKMALLFALEREKGTITFFKKISRLIRFDNAVITKKIIIEEHKHVRLLSEVIKKLGTISK